MTLILVCPNGHAREVHNVTSPVERALFAECVRRRIASCFVCRRAMVRVEEKEQPS